MGINRETIIYFRSIIRIPLMSPEEELKVAGLYQATKEKKFADQLVKANLRFVIKTALRYENYGNLLDLIQEGNVGLVRAVRSYDPEKGYRLISYAVWWIRAFIQEYILRNWSLVKIGTTQTQRKLFNFLQSSTKREKLLWNLDTHDEKCEALAEKLEIRVEEIRETMLRLMARDESLDENVNIEGDWVLNLHETYASEQENGAAFSERKENERYLDRQLIMAFSALPKRERVIIVCRFLLDKPLTLREVSEKLGVCRERVRQLQVRALKGLKEFMLRQGVTENSDFSLGMDADLSGTTALKLRITSAYLKKEDKAREAVLAEEKPSVDPELDAYIAMLKEQVTADGAYDSDYLMRALPFLNYGNIREFIERMVAEEYLEKFTEGSQLYAPTQKLITLGNELNTL